MVEAVKFSMVVTQTSVDAVAAGSVSHGESFWPPNCASIRLIKEASVGVHRGGCSGVTIGPRRTGGHGHCAGCPKRRTAAGGDSSAGAEESFGDFSDLLPATEHPVQTISLRILKTENSLAAFQSAIRRVDALRALPPSPSGAVIG